MTYPISAPASGAYPINTAWGSAGTFANTDQNNTNSVGNYAWGGIDSVPVGARVATTGAETFTIVSGSVTVINGTTIDGVSVAVNDPVLIKDAPSASGVGSPLSSQPGNGMYYVTAVATNISVSRAATMSSTSAQPNPAGRLVYVRAGTKNAVTMWSVTTPSGVAAFTYGTTAMQWSNFVLQTLSSPSSAGVPNTAIQQAGINNFNTAVQSQVVVSAQAYYITNSALTMPATPLTGMVANKTTFVWNVTILKTTNTGTGTFAIAIYRGTTGTVAGDAQDVLQTLGTQTAVIDTLNLNVQLTVTTVGGVNTGAYFWAMNADNRAGTAAGFSIPATGAFNGTVSSKTLTTASMIFGLAFVSTTGTPTITVPAVQAFAYNMD
jgi:hypothetical protein